MTKQIHITELRKLINDTVRGVLTEEDVRRNLYSEWLGLQKKHGPEKVLYAVWKELDTDQIEFIINSMEGVDNGTESE